MMLTPQSPARVAYEIAVLNAMCELLDVGYGDASAIMEADESYVSYGFANGHDPLVVAALY